jgi:hypothetical protein
VVQTKLLQAAGVPFRVADIPRTLRGGCGLCIRLQCPPGAEQQWVCGAGHLPLRGEAFEQVAVYYPHPENGAVRPDALYG